MLLRKSPLQLIAIAYGVVVLTAAAWALVVDIRLLHSTREHLLPDILLMLIAMPMSQTLETLYDVGPEFFKNEIGQVVWVTVCGLLQAGLLYLIGSFMVGKDAA